MNQKFIVQKRDPNRHETEKMFNRGKKSHKKQIICLKDEEYEDERNLLVYLFCAKGYFSLPGSLTKARARRTNEREKNIVHCVVQLSTSWLMLNIKIYKLWSVIILVEGCRGSSAEP